MTETAARAMDLPEQVRDALVDLVVRGMSHGEPTAAQAELVAAGLALAKGGLLMPIGDANVLAGSVLLIPAGSPEQARVRALFELFLPINRQLRELCTAWQCRPDGSVNDHGDPVYDAGVRDRLDDIDDAVAPVLARLASDLPRAAVYPARLHAALDSFDAGDLAWLASPRLDSYHTVWMQLHQELLLSLGISRKEDEELEDLLVSGKAG